MFGLAKKFRVKPNSTCPVCGQEFYAEPNRIAKSSNGVVYCSNECAKKMVKAGRKNLRHIFQCKQCGADFEVKNHRITDGSNPQFCSQSCAGKFSHAESIARNAHVCAHCGKTFSRDATSLRKTSAITGGKVYCSAACSFAHTRSRGKKNKFETDFHNVFKQLAFTGDGSWVISDHEGFMNPDFVLPGTNKVVELWGNYWHAGENPEHRIGRLRRLGYDAIVIWEDDFRKHAQDTIRKVTEFL